MYITNIYAIVYRNIRIYTTSVVVLCYFRYL